MSPTRTRFRLDFLTIFFLILFVGMGSSFDASGQARKSAQVTWEVLVINDWSSNVFWSLLNTETSSLADSGSLEPGLSQEFSFGGTHGVGDVQESDNVLYRFDIRVGATTHTYLYMQCDNLSGIPAGKAFFCPNEEFSSSADMRIISNGSGSIEMDAIGVEPAAGVDPNILSHFSDDNWILPYNFDTYCAGATSTCGFEKVKWFLTPGTSTTNFTFTAKDLVQPSNRDWHFEDVTVTFPASKTMTINKGLEIDNSTLKFSDNSALIYDGDINNFLVDAGTTFELGDNVRFTFENQIKLLAHLYLRLPSNHSRPGINGTIWT